MVTNLHTRFTLFLHLAVIHFLDQQVKQPTPTLQYIFIALTIILNYTLYKFHCFNFNSYPDKGCLKRFLISFYLIFQCSLFNPNFNAFFNVNFLNLSFIFKQWSKLRKNFVFGNNMHAFID